MGDVIKFGSTDEVRFVTAVSSTEITVNIPIDYALSNGDIISRKKPTILVAEEEVTNLILNSLGADIIVESSVIETVSV